MKKLIFILLLITGCNSSTQPTSNNTQNLPDTTSFKLTGYWYVNGTQVWHWIQYNTDVQGLYHSNQITDSTTMDCHIKGDSLIGTMTAYSLKAPQTITVAAKIISDSSVLGKWYGGLNDFQAIRFR